MFSDVQLTLDDELVVVNSVGGPRLVGLPAANQIPSLTLFIQALNAGTNPVTIQALAGQTINGFGSVVLTTDLQSVILVANPTIDGVTNPAGDWSICGTGGSGLLGAALGDLGAPGGAPTPSSPNYPNPAVVGIQGVRVDPTAPVLNQGLVYNGASWQALPIVYTPLVFGAEVLPGAGPFFLPPGFDLSGSVLPATEIPVKATQNERLRFLHMQQTPGTGTGNVVVTVFIGGAATPLTVTLPVTGTDANNVADFPLATSNANISVQVDYTGLITTPPSRMTVAFQAVTG